MKRSYQKPPVLEALGEVYFRGSEWDATIPGLFFEKIRHSLPKKGQRTEVSVEVALGPATASARTTATEPRSQFSREDGSQMVQVGRDLVVVNQLRPYPKFEEWRPIVLKMTSIYKELAKPAGVARIGIRYINRIEIPESTFPMERYFKLYPEIPVALGGSHGAFMIRVEIPPLHQGHQLLVTFGSAPPEKEGTFALLLDLYDTVVPKSDGAFEAIEEYLEQGHDNVERAFESIITDTSRKLFEEIPGDS